MINKSNSPAKAVKFFMNPDWAPFIFGFSFMFALAMAAVTAINYWSTNDGFLKMRLGGEAVLWDVELYIILAFLFMILVQGYEFFAPVVEYLDLFEDSPRWNDIFIKAWLVVLALDWLTAVLFLTPPKMFIFPKYTGDGVQFTIVLFGWLIALVPYVVSALVFLISEIFFWASARVAIDRWHFMKKTGKYEEKKKPEGAPQMGAQPGMVPGMGSPVPAVMPSSLAVGNAALDMYKAGVDSDAILVILGNPANLQRSQAEQFGAKILAKASDPVAARIIAKAKANSSSAPAGAVRPVMPPPPPAKSGFKLPAPLAKFFP